MALKCPLCKDAKILPVDKENVAAHLVVTKNHDGHTHVHGPVSNKAAIQDLVLVILKEAGIAYSIAPEQRTEKISEDKEGKD